MTDIHAPFPDDGVTYCGWATDNGIHEGCGEVWPCSTVRDTRATETSQPTGLGSKEGEQDGKKGGVHPGRTRQAAEESDRRGIHAGSGVLDRPGLIRKGDSVTTLIED